MSLKSNLYLASAAAALGIAAIAPAQTTTPTTPAPGTAQTGAPAAPAAAANPMVGGVAMDATKPIAANASAAPNLSTLVKAVNAAGLATTLSGPGPFTVFAPTNEAFGRLTPGSVDSLMQPANKAALAKVLTYHVVPGTVTLDDLKAKVAAGNGKAVLTTVEGQPLSVEIQNNVVSLTDASGNKSYVETADVRQSNGVVHVVNGVLLPKMG